MCAYNAVRIEFVMPLSTRDWVPGGNAVIVIVHFVHNAWRVARSHLRVYNACEQLN